MVRADLLPVVAVRRLSCVCDRVRTFMISTLRRLFVDSWVGRAIAILIFLAFVGWGMGDVFTNFGGSSPDTVAKIGSRTVSAQQLASTLRNQLPQTARQMGLSDPSQLPEAARTQAARETLQQLVTQTEVALAAERAGMRVPDDLVREEVFGLSFFKGANGHFDRSVFNQRLQQAGLTEAKLIDLIREDLTVRGLLQSMGATMRAPAGLSDRLIGFNTRLHVADIARIASDGMPAPATPTDGQLHRYYDNHPWEFRTTEYRHAKIVELTADSVSRSIETPDDELKKLYEFQARRYHLPETRTLQVVTMPSEDRAQAIARSWKQGGSWTQVQADAHDGAAVELPDARETDVPNPDLAHVAFSAPANVVTGPIKTETGWAVFIVTKITPPHVTSFEDAKQALRDEVTKAQAPQLLQARKQQFQDAVAGSNTLDAIPASLGAVPAAGTLDDQGMTKDGAPAPLPGDEKLRQAVVARIFAQGKGARPTVVAGPAGSSFAVYVDDVSPGAVQPFETVREQVTQAWRQAALLHEADLRATDLFTAAKKGGVAAAVGADAGAGVTLARGHRMSRVKPDQTVPEAVAQAVFGLAVGQSAMIDAQGQYYVLTVTGIEDAPAAETAPLLAQVGDSLSQSIQNDVPTAYVNGLERDVKPDINMHVFDEVVHQSGGTTP